ncbi:MAG: iron-containing alcohol dehydrogenase [Pirellulales bacterium]|nr:iron-containing alcohol dehydrogenase [Pirellulales bacterium]
MVSSLTTYDFLAPPRMVFGWGRRREMGRFAASLGRRAFVVSGSTALERKGILAEVLETVAAAGIEGLHVASLSREPEVADVDRLAADLVENNVGRGDFVIGIGGGSAIDLAKAAAAMATNRDSTTVADFLEGVGRGLQIENDPLPMMAIPTTAGTGSEATKNAVISSNNPPFKKSLRADSMLPRVVLIDPELSVSVPPSVTAQTGMDAITQLIESYISRRAKPIPQALAIQGLQLAMPALAVAVRDGANRAAREAMAHAALLSGIALANSGLGMAHGVAAALGAECKVRHGLACAVMLPVALRANLSACEAELAQLARETCDVSPTATSSAASYALIHRIDELGAEIGIPSRLADLGVRREQIPTLVAASHGNSMSGNPRAIGDGELTELLENML